MTPLECFSDIMTRARELVILHRHLKDNLALLSTTPQCDTIQVRDDVLRCSIVFALAALDRYLHERVCKEIVQVFSRPSTLTRKQRELALPAIVAFQVAKKAAHNAKVNPASKSGPRPARAANLVRNAIREMLHKRPFQSWRELEDAMALIGITNVESQLKPFLSATGLRSVKESLSHAAHIRNRIVHEGHIERRLRGGAIKHGWISPADVEATINDIQKLVEGLEKCSSAAAITKRRK